MKKIYFLAAFLLFCFELNAQKNINPIPLEGTELLISADAVSPSRLKFKIYAANTSDNLPQADKIDVYPFTESNFQEKILRALLKQKGTNEIESIAVNYINNINAVDKDSVVGKLNKKKDLLKYLLESLTIEVIDSIKLMDDIKSNTKLFTILGQKGTVLEESLKDIDIDKALISLLETFSNTNIKQTLTFFKNILISNTLIFKPYIGENFLKKILDIQASDKLLSEKAITIDMVHKYRSVYLHFYNMTNVLFQYDSEPIAGTISYDTIFNIIYNAPGISEVFIRKKAREIYRDSINKVGKSRKLYGDSVKHYHLLLSNIENILRKNNSKHPKKTVEKIQYMDYNTKSIMIEKIDSILIRSDFNISEMEKSIKKNSDSPFLYYDKERLKKIKKSKQNHNILRKSIIEFYKYRESNNNLFSKSKKYDFLIKKHRFEEGRSYVINELIKDFKFKRLPKHLDSVVEGIKKIKDSRQKIEKRKQDSIKGSLLVDILYKIENKEFDSMSNIIEKLREKKLVEEQKLATIENSPVDESKKIEYLSGLIEEIAYPIYDDWFEPLEIGAGLFEIVTEKENDSIEKDILKRLKESPRFEFVAEEIKFTIDDGFIENIQVIGNISSTEIPNDYREENKKVLEEFLEEKKYLKDSLARELKFENVYPIGFSAETDFQDLSRYTLYHYDKKFGTYELKLRDVFKNYFQVLGNDRLDYSPKNQVVSLRDADPNNTMRVSLKKQVSSKLLSLDVFSDFIGFSDEGANGILQLEVNKDIPLNTKRYLIRPFRGKLDRSLNIGVFNYLNFTLNWKRLENNEFKDLGVTYLDRFENNRYSPIKYVSHLDLLRHENLAVGVEANVFSLDMPSWKLKWEINAGARFGRTKVLDKEREYVDDMFVEQENPSSKQINTWRLFPQLKIKIRPEERFGALLSWTPTFYNTTTASFSDVSSEEAFLSSGIDEFQFLHRIQMLTHFTPSANSDNRFFFRYRYTNSFDWQYNGFHEVQVGYSAYLKF